MPFKITIKHLIHIVVFTSSLITIAHASEQPSSTNSYGHVGIKISELMRQYHYNPAELTLPEYLKTEQAMLKIANEVTNKDEFIQKFNQLWQSGPFSR